LNDYIKVGIFDSPKKVKIGDTVEFVYNCNNVEDRQYNYRVKGKVKAVNPVNILVELPIGFKQIGSIKGWPGKEKSDSNPSLAANRLYWWVATFRILSKNLEIEWKESMITQKI